MSRKYQARKYLVVQAGPWNQRCRWRLQIADYGLARFHERELRSEVDFIKAYGPLTYGPPESKLRKHVSRAYDIWSPGCILLEFITWLLEVRPQLNTLQMFGEK